MPRLVCAVVSTLSFVLAGCAPQHEAMRAAPAPDELPDLKGLPRAIPARVGVETFERPPRTLIVQRPVEPPLTPEQRQALGVAEDDDPLDLLKFYRPRSETVAPQPAGAQVGAHGAAGVSAGQYAGTVVSAAYGASGGVGAGRLSSAVSHAGTYLPAYSVWGIGRAVQVSAGIGPACRVARRSPFEER